MKLSTVIFLSAIVLTVALSINFGIGNHLGMDKKAVSDPYYFLQLARTMASGGGYVAHNSHWPDSPTMRSLPGWPFTLSIALRLFPDFSPDTVMRILSLTINSLIAVGIFWLTFLLFRRLPAAFFAGIAYILHPTALFTAYHGCSEPLFLLLVTVGLLFVTLRMKSALFCCIGSFLLGCSCLVRPNFILFGFFIIIISCILWLKERSFLSCHKILMLCFYIILFAGPTFIWTLRNYTICHHFPVISTLRGHTFYGGNNPVVANTLGYWGYWVFPDSIPGEKTMAELSKSMSEYEVDYYYFEKGKQYILKNWFFMPRLLLGKFIRAYVPIPFGPIWETYIASLYRWLLYLGTAIGLYFGWKKISLFYRVCLVSMALTNFVMVMIFWGHARFALALEPFFLPFLGIAIVTSFYRVSKNPINGTVIKLQFFSKIFFPRTF